MLPYGRELRRHLPRHSGHGMHLREQELLTRLQVKQIPAFDLGTTGLPKHHACAKSATKRDHVVRYALTLLQKSQNQMFDFRNECHETKPHPLRNPENTPMIGASPASEKTQTHLSPAQKPAR